MADVRRLAVSIGLILLTLPTATQAGQAAAPPPARRWAVLIGDSTDARASTAAQQAAGAALIERYGFTSERVFDLLDARATRTNIRERLIEVGKQVRPVDALFVYVLLPIVDRGKGPEYFRTRDGRDNEVWTLIGRDEIEEAVATFPTRTSLTIINACSDGPLFAGSKAWTMQSTPALRGGGRASTIRFCDRTAPDRGAARFASAFTALLSSGPQSNDRLRDVEIHTRLRGQLRDMDIDLEPPARALDERFEFVLDRRHATTLVDDLSTAATPDQQLRAIDSLVGAFRSSPDGRTRTAILESLTAFANGPNAARSPRLRAIAAIGETQATQALSALAGMTTAFSEPEFRAAAVSALARIPDRETVSRLITALNDGSPAVRVAAVRGLGNHQQLARADEIVARVADPAPEVRASALQMLSLLARPKEGGRNLITTIAGAARKAAQRALTDDSPEVRREGVTTLPLLGVDLARDRTAIRMLAGDNDALVRKAIALTLGREYRGVWEGPGAAEEVLKTKPQREPALAALITTADPASTAPPDVRAAALWSLGEIRDERANQVLLRSAEDPDPGVRESAIEALGKIRHRPAVPLIAANLRSGSARIRAAAARSLGLMRASDTAAPLLAQLSSEKDVYVRQALEEALHRLPSPSLQALADALTDESPKVRREAVERLEKTTDAAAAQLAIDALGDADADVREQALKVISDRAKEWFGAIAAAADTPKATIRFGLAVALGEFGSSAAGTVLLARLRAEQNPSVKAAIVEGLGSIRPTAPEIENALLAMAQQPDPMLRAVAASALRAYASPRVRDALKALAEDEEPAVRQSAISSLRTIIK